jgi:hypothetical protein
MAKRLKAVLLPEVRDADDDEGKPQIPPEAQQQMTQMSQQIEAMGAALNNASQQVDKLENTAHADAENRRVAAFKAESDRLKMVLPYLPPDAIAAIAHSVGLQAVQTEDILPPQSQTPQGLPQEPTEQPTEPPQQAVF